MNLALVSSSLRFYLIMPKVLFEPTSGFATWRDKPNEFVLFQVRLMKAIDMTHPPLLSFQVG